MKLTLNFIQKADDRNLRRLVIKMSDPTTVYVLLRVPLGQLCCKDTLLVTVSISDPKTQPFEQHYSEDYKLSIAGKVVKLGTNMVQLASKSQGTLFSLNPASSKSRQSITLQILTFEVCSHKRIPNQNTQELDLCELCSETLWCYYDEAVVKLTVADVLRLLDPANSRLSENLSWKVVPNDQFTRSTVLATSNDEELRLDFAGKVVKINNGDFEQLQPQDSILEVRKIICRHEKIQNYKSQNFSCLFCLQGVDKDSIKESNYLFQGFQIGQVITSGRLLQHQEDNYVNNLIQNKRCLLILDLDNTILHSLFRICPASKAVPQSSETLYVEAVAFLKPFDPNSCIVQKIFVKIRPYFAEFITEVIHLFEVLIYTKGTRKYALSICEQLRKIFTGKSSEGWDGPCFDLLSQFDCFKPQTILSRDEDCDPRSKRCDRVLPTRRDCLLILDDSSKIWQAEKKMCIYTPPFYYFLLDSPDTSQQINLMREIKKNIPEVTKQPQLNEVQDPSNALSQVTHAIQAAGNGDAPSIQTEQDTTLESNETNSSKNSQEGQRVIETPIVSSLEFQEQKRYEPQNQNELTVEDSKQSKQKVGVSEDTVDIQKQMVDISPKLNPPYVPQEAPKSQPQLQDLYFGHQEQISRRKLRVEKNKFKAAVTRGLRPGETISLRNDPDYFLLFASHTMRNVHERYFAGRDQGTIFSLGVLYYHMRNSMLNGISACFVGTKKQQYYGLKLEAEAKQIGLTVLQTETNVKPSLIIRHNELSSQEVLELKSLSQSLSIPVVSQTWLYACLDYSYSFPYAGFVIEEPLRLKVSSSEFEGAIAQEAMKIKDRIHSQYPKFFKKEQS